MSPQEENKRHLPEITDAIVKTYRDVGTINHLEASPLPRYEEIISVLEDLKEILFPGYRKREQLDFRNVGFYICLLYTSPSPRD